MSKFRETSRSSLATLSFLYKICYDFDGRQWIYMQYSFSFIDQRACLENKLSQLVKMPVRLTLTNNISTYFSYRLRKGVLAIRIHKNFVGADDKTIAAIARLAMRRDKRASRLVRDFFDLAPPISDQDKRRNFKVETTGRYHDLQDIFDRLNSAYFENEIDAQITWGNTWTSRRKRSLSHIQLGSYNDRLKRITIHPHLDREGVPEFFVEAIVYHEMCHQVVISKKTPNGTKSHHSRDFTNLEKKYPAYLKAKSWQKKNLSYLLKR
jgi:predicted SprT family Zn-dependent metalloprotease